MQCAPRDPPGSTLDEKPLRNPPTDSDAEVGVQGEADGILVVVVECLVGCGWRRPASMHHEVIARRRRRGVAIATRNDVNKLSN